MTETKENQPKIENVTLEEVFKFKDIWIIYRISHRTPHVLKIDAKRKRTGKINQLDYVTFFPTYNYASELNRKFWGMPLEDMFAYSGEL